MATLPVGRITEVLATLLGCPVIASEPEVAGAPQPALPYVTVKAISSSVRHGVDYLTSDLTASVGPRTAILSCNVFGNTHEEAADVAQQLCACVEDEAASQGLANLGVAVYAAREEDIRDLSELYNPGYRARMQLDLRLGYLSSYALQVDIIEEAPVVGTASL